MDLSDYLNMSDLEMRNIVVTLAGDAGTPQETKDILTATVTHWDATKGEIPVLQQDIDSLLEQLKKN
jgi:hypothetical protein